ncbi:MAG: phospholipid scramblase-related protein [Chloroflexi bacterium]|nr:phospholipid scramblase-related protein [Chloroflexota bacterium]
MRRTGSVTRQLLDLTRVNSVRIEQRVEGLEMFTGIEGANAYDVLNPDGQVIAHAAESTGGMHRVLLGSSRLESIALRNAAGEQVAAGVAALGRDFAGWDEAREWQRGVLPLISEDAVARRLHSRMVEQDGRIAWREDPDILKHRDRNPAPAADERWSTLRGGRCGTLFLLGGDSGLVTDETAQKAATTVPDGEWLHIPGAGHNVFEDNPADAISAITRFLSGDPQIAYRAPARSRCVALTTPKPPAFQSFPMTTTCA